MKKSLLSITALILAGLLLNSCTTEKPKSSEVVLWQLADPGMLNPYLASDNASADIDNNIFQALLDFDYKTLKLVPVLADSLPEVKIDSAGRMLITYRIRKEAKWDNGSPVSAKDVAFTLKIIKNPAVNDESYKPYFDLVSDIILYDNDPKKFTIIYDKKYALAVIATGTDIFVMPEYAYDPNKYMDKFTVKQMQKDTGLARDAGMIAFAKDFNSDKYSRDPQFISGSGAYHFAQWTTGQRVTLEKKANWWGDALAGSSCYFDAYPSKLIYQTISDMTSALVSVKAGNINVLGYIRPPDFADLHNSVKFTEKYNIYQPLRMAYSYIGINMANPKFADISTRKAIAHIVNVQRLIKDVYYGYAQQVIGPVSPMDSVDYNYNIKPYEYSIDTAKALLAAAGWKDSDGDGILDKVIDGKKTDFTVDFLCPSGSEQRKKVGLVFKEEARKLGIDVNVKQQENNVFQENLKTHNFEMYTGGWYVQPGPQDYKQIFYTTSALDKGSNYISFGNAASDALIDSMRVELDPVKQSQMLKRLQVILHDQCGYIFLFAQEALIAIDKKYSNAYPSPMNPFYWEAGFKASTDK